MACAWKNFKNIFSRPLFTIIFRPEMLKFHPYSVLTRNIMVGFVIFCVLRLFLVLFSTENKHLYNPLPHNCLRNIWMVPKTWRNATPESLSSLAMDLFMKSTTDLQRHLISAFHSWQFNPGIRVEVKLHRFIFWWLLWG